ncbi:MAG: PKD domain-containing protein, partial [Chloroflexi bacterium]|nr:PKD domain-containing protein [Chloroflexota bacterium]
TGASPGAVISFSDQSTGNATGWSWNFGDGSGSSSQNPSKSYVSSGNYSVSLTASNAAGSHTLTRSDYITVTSTGVGLQAETTLVPDIDSGGYAVVRVGVSRIKNGAGETFAIDGIAGYGASLTYDAAGATVLAVTGVAPFGSPAVEMNTLSGTRTNFSASQTGSSPAAPLTTADVRLRLVGKHNPSPAYAATALNFNSISRVNGGGEIPQSAAATFSFVRGDANNSGDVTITDALFIAQYLAGLRQLGTTGTTVNAVNAASVYQDGANGDRVSIQDALFTAQMLAGLRNDFYN